MKKENPFESRLTQLENEMEFVRQTIDNINEYITINDKRNEQLHSIQNLRILDIVRGFKFIISVLAILSILNMVSLYLRYTGKM